MARPKLTKKLTEKICQAIGAGMTYKDACLYAGIGESTYYNWMARAEKAKSGIYKDFLEAVQDARNKAKNALVTTMHKCAAGGIKTIEFKRKVDPATGNILEEEQIHKTTLPDSRTALAILARRYPAEWAELTKHDIKGHIAMPPIDMSISDEAKKLMLDKFGIVPEGAKEEE